MKTEKRIHQDINDYISDFEPEIRERLELIRATIQEVLPDAVEVISYGIPTFKMEKNLVHFGGYKNHIGYYAGPEAIALCAAKIKSYKQATGSVQFPHHEPLPLEVIQEMAVCSLKLYNESLK